MPRLRHLPLSLALFLGLTWVLSALVPQEVEAKPRLIWGESKTTSQLPVAKKGFPHPKDRHQLFFVQRTMNANTVVYAAKFDANGMLDARRPIVGYWRRYEEQGQTMALRWYERVFGYGVRTRRHANGRDFVVSFNAMRTETLELRQTGPFQAALWTRRNNRDFELVYGFLDLDEGGVLPRVERLRLYTTDPATGRYVTHLIAVSGGEYHE
ncbi:DUF4833 domain-containing protein [Shimia sp. W99]